jgi:hypothetical protein
VDGVTESAQERRIVYSTTSLTHLFCSSTALTARHAQTCLELEEQVFGLASLSLVRIPAVLLIMQILQAMRNDGGILAYIDAQAPRRGSSHYYSYFLLHLNLTLVLANASNPEE